MKTITVVLLAIVAFGSAPAVLGASGEVDHTSYDAAKSKAEADVANFVIYANKYRSDLYDAQTVIITQLETYQSTITTSLQNSGSGFLFLIGGGTVYQPLATLIATLKQNRDANDLYLANYIQTQSNAFTGYIASVQNSANFAVTQVQYDALTATLQTFSSSVETISSSSSYDITQIQSSFTAASARAVKASQDLIAAINSKNFFAYSAANTILGFEAVSLPAAFMTTIATANAAFQSNITSIVLTGIPIF